MHEEELSVLPTGFHSVLRHGSSPLARLVAAPIFPIRMKAGKAKNFFVVVKMRLTDLFITAKNWKQPKYPLSAKWINKAW